MAHGYKIALGATATVVLLVAVMGYRRRKEISALLSKWAEAGKLIKDFAERMNLGEEVNLLGFKLPFPVILAFLSACQSQEDARKASKASATRRRGRVR